MLRFARPILNFLKREDGPAAVEYAVMLAPIITVCFAAITSLGNNSKAAFTNASTPLGS
jgi:pilus assembly protein Flp/PilA